MFMPRSGDSTYGLKYRYDKQRFIEPRGAICPRRLTHPILVFVIEDMGQKQSKRISAESKKNPEGKVRMDQKVAALEDRTRELEEAAQAISVEKAIYERTLASMSGTIDKLVLERAEEKAEFEHGLAAMSETIERRVLEGTEKQKADSDRKLAAMLEMIGRVVEATEIQRAGCELKLTAMSQRIDELVQETAKKNALMDHSLVALERTTTRIEQSSQKKAGCEQTPAALSETIEKRVLERTEIQKAECELKLAAMSQRIHEVVQKKTDEKVQMDLKVAALEDRTRELEEAAQAISAEKAVCEQTLASMSGTIDKLVLERAEEKAEFEQRLAAMSETIDRRVLEGTETQNADGEVKLAALTEIIASLVCEKMEMQMEAMIELNADVTAEPTDLSILATAEESMEFREKSAARPDTIDLQLLTTTQDKMTATSTDPINIAPTAPGSHDPSGVQLNSSEQLKSHLDGALSEERAVEENCSSCHSLVESLRSQGRDFHTRGLDIGNKGLDREQDKQTAALDFSSVSQLQEEMRLPAPEQSPNPETPAVEEKMETDHGQNESETSDELSLGPEPCAELEESFKLLNSDERLMKKKGLELIYPLAKHQPDTLLRDRQDICRAILREVLNPLDWVSEVALGTLAELLPLLNTFFDPFMDRIADALYEKAASDNNENLQRLTNVALDRMIRSCSPRICMNELVSILSNPIMPDPDQEAVPRECIAALLLALVESMPYYPDMHELFLSFSHLTQDTSEVVRSCAEKMIVVLGKHLESVNPETPAVEEKMKTDHGQNESETSDELSLGPEPCAELEESFKLLNSDERWKKMEGLHLIYQLAKQQPETLFPDMEYICQVVLREALNPLDSVSAVALWTLAGLLSLLKTYFDPFLDGVGDVLYLKAASDNETHQQLVSVALDLMIQSCSPLICMKVLLSKLSHPITEDPVQEEVAREFFAVYLLALVDSGRYEPEMHELFLSFSHLTQDTSGVVRSCAEETLAILLEHLEVPVVAASSETTASPSGPAPSEPKFPSVDVNKKKLQDTLNAILPPRVWSDGNKQWMQQVSSKPATRADVIKLQQQLDLQLQQRQARETGICPIRRELYSQCFDELIRQTTIRCAERGLLLLRVRDESLMCMAAYQTLYENSVASGAREVQLSELSKAEMERKVPVVAASSETTASPSGPAPSEPKFPSVDVNKKKLQDTLNAILPPRVWSDGNKQWMQQVSSKPATRADVIKLQQQLDLQLQQRQARETGICPIRRELYSQCFDELIRQTTIGCVERGLLLQRVRDESLMCMAAYQTLYENSVASGAREVQLSELSKAEMERKESMEFWENSAATPDTTDLQLLTTTQEKMTATSTDPINIAPTAPGSRDPSGVQSKSCEQLQSQQLQEVTLLPPEQSTDPETPAVEERMQTDRGQTVFETSDELLLGPEPRAELEECFKLLNSDEGLMKIKGLELIYQLAKHQPDTLLRDRQDICRAILREVLNPLDWVSEAALGTLADLLSLLKTFFDPFVDRITDALYEKAASDNDTLQRLTNVALDRMIRSCSPRICMNELVSILSNRIMPDPDQEAVPRECIAVHLLALVESMRYEPEMDEICLSVCQLLHDTSEVVRSCVEKMLPIFWKHMDVSKLLDMYYNLKYGIEPPSAPETSN